MRARAWSLCWVVCVALSLVASAARAAGRSIVFVDETEALGIAANSALPALLGDRVEYGLRASERLKDGSSEVVTLYDLKRLSNGALEHLQYLNTWKRTPIERAATRLLNLGAQATMTNYISVRLVALDHHLRLELRMFQVEGDNRQQPLVAVKSVTVNDGEEANLIAGAYDAAKALFDTATPPTARVQAPALVAVGAPVVIDASGSTDLEHDDFSFEWRTEDDVAWQSSGATLSFVPLQAKQYTFTLRLRQVHPLDRISEAKVVSVRALARPEVRVAPSQPVAMTPEPARDHGKSGKQPVLVTNAQLELSGECHNCKDARWTQVQGPIVPVPESCTSPGAADDHEWRPVTCRVSVHEAGAFAFALVASNDLERVRATQSFVVSPRPLAWLSVPDGMIVERDYTLSGSGSHDALAAPLSYRWQVLDHRYESDDEATPDYDHAANATLSNPLGVETTFRASKSGWYYLRLCVTATRELDARKVSVSQCEARAVHVKEPDWLLFATGGGDFVPRRDNNWLGFRLQLGTTIRWPFPAFGIRVAQNLLRSTPAQDSHKTQIDLGGGTSVAAAFIPGRVIQPFLGVFGSTWGGSSFLAGDAGLDVRPLTYLVLSPSTRYQQLADGKWTWIVSAQFGLGYNL